MSRLWKDLVVAAGLVTTLIACSGGSGSSGPITGTILGSDGKPAVGAMVNLGWKRDMEDSHSLRSYSRLDRGTMAGFDGSFSIPAPDGPGPWVMTVNHADFATAFREVEAGQEDIEVTLEEGWKVKGAVQWEEGLGMEQCRVELARTPDLRPVMDTSGVDFVEMGDGWSLERIANGSYTLMVSPDFGGAPLHRQELKLEGDGGHLDLGTIDLSGKLIRTAFTLRSGSTSQDLEVLVVDGDGLLLKAERGRSITAYYPMGTQELALWIEGHRTVLVEDPEEEMDVVLEPGIPVAIEFDPVDGFPDDVFMITELTRVEDPSGGETLPGYLTRQVLPSVGQDLRMPAPGHYRVNVLLGLVAEGSFTGHSEAVTYVASAEEAPVIEVQVGSELQVIPVRFEDGAVMRAVARLRAME